MILIANIIGNYLISPYHIDRRES